MAYLPGDIFYRVWVTNNSSGVSQNLDATPKGVLDRNGVDDFSVNIFFNNIDLGRYNLSGVIPSTYKGGNSISVTVSGTLNGSATKSVFDLGVLDRAVSVTGLVQSNVVAWSGTTVTPTNSFGMPLVDMRYINGIPSFAYNGIAQTGTLNSIRLASTEPAIDNYYQWALVALVGGVGANQFGICTSYSGITKDLYVDNNWITVPDSSTQYSFVGYGRVNSQYIQDQILSTKVGLNFNNFFQDGGRTSNQILDNLSVNVTGFAPSNFIVPNSIRDDVSISVTGANVWTANDLLQLRYKIGLDGSALSPTGQYNGQLELSNSGLRKINVENGINAHQWMSMMGAVIAGSSTVNGSNITYYAMNNNGVTRLQSTASSGTRQVVVLFLP